MLYLSHAYYVRQALLFADAMSAIGFPVEVSFGDYSLTLTLPKVDWACEDESAYESEYPLHWAVCQAFFLGLCDSVDTEDYSIRGNVMHLAFS